MNKPYHPNQNTVARFSSENTPFGPSQYVVMATLLYTGSPVSINLHQIQDENQVVKFNNLNMRHNVLTNNDIKKCRKECACTERGASTRISTSSRYPPRILDYI